MGCKNHLRLPLLEHVMGPPNPTPPTPKGSIWIRVYIFYPLVPFLIDGLVRLVASGYALSLFTFSSATLTMSVSLLSIFVNQSILAKTPTLSNDQEVEDIVNAASKFMTYAIFGIAGFGIIVILIALEEFHQMPTKPIVARFSLPIYILSTIPIINAIRAQKVLS